jgi:hypothetical protein
VGIGSPESIGNYKAGYICAADREPFRLQTNNLSSRKLVAWWHDPRTVKARRSDTFARTKIRTFTPPSSGIGSDWGLVLDNAAKKFPTPGLIAGGTGRAQAPPGQNRTRQMKAAGWFQSLMRFGIATGIPLMIFLDAVNAPAGLRISCP